MIAVDMLTHTFRGNMHTATLLTGDNDFKPLIDALVREGMFIQLQYPPGETNAELVNAADARVPLTLRTLHSWLTEDSRERFVLPEVQNRPPEDEHGVRIAQWRVDGVQLVLNYYEGAYWVLRDGDNLNRLNVWHPDSALMRVFCAELGFPIPESIDLRSIENVTS